VPPFEKLTHCSGKSSQHVLPGKVSPIFSLDHLKDCVCNSGFSQSRISDLNESGTLEIQADKSVGQRLVERQVLQFSLRQVSAHNPILEGSSRRERKVVAECLQGGFMCIGWNEIGDMRQQTDAAAFKEKYVKRMVLSGFASGKKFGLSPRNSKGEM